MCVCVCVCVCVLTLHSPTHSSQSCIRHSCALFTVLHIHTHSSHPYTLFTSLHTLRSPAHSSQSYTHFTVLHTLHSHTYSSQSNTLFTVLHTLHSLYEVARGQNGVRNQASHSRKQQNRKTSYIVYTVGSFTKDQLGWGFTVKQGGTTIHKDSGISLVATVGKGHHTRGNVMLTERW